MIDLVKLKENATTAGSIVNGTKIKAEGNQQVSKIIMGIDTTSGNTPASQESSDVAPDQDNEAVVFNMPAPESWVDGIEGVWDNSKKDINIDGYIKLYDKNNADSGVVFIKLVHRNYYNESNIDTDMYSRLASSDMVWYLNGNRNSNNIYPSTDATSLVVESTGEKIDFIHNQRLYGWTQPSFDSWVNYAPSNINNALELAYFDSTGLQVRRNSVSTPTRLGLIEVFKGTPQ